MKTTCVCGSTCVEEGGFGLDVCMSCGLGRVGAFNLDEYTFQDRLVGHQTYPRLKRFKKYLHRATRQQSNCTIPQETWEYLQEHRPYRDAKHIQYTLKHARHLKRKCYDSLPFLTHALCPNVRVPTLSEEEKRKAMAREAEAVARGENPFYHGSIGTRGF